MIDPSLPWWQFTGFNIDAPPAGKYPINQLDALKITIALTFRIWISGKKYDSARVP